MSVVTRYQCMPRCNGTRMSEWLKMSTFLVHLSKLGWPPSLNLGQKKVVKLNQTSQSLTKIRSMDDLQRTDVKIAILKSCDYDCTCMQKLEQWRRLSWQHHPYRYIQSTKQGTLPVMKQHTKINRKGRQSYKPSRTLPAILQELLVLVPVDHLGGVLHRFCFVPFLFLSNTF